MTIQANTTVITGVAFAKNLCLYASRLSSFRTNALNRVISVICFDLATENGLRLILHQLDKNFRPEKDITFNSLVQSASDKLIAKSLGALPEEANIRTLHHIRNDAQHNGRFPGDEEVSLCRRHATSFLASISKQVWGISFDEIALSSLISNPMLKSLFQEAEAALAGGLNKEAIDKSMAALDYAIRRVESYSSVVGSTLSAGQIEDIVAYGAIRKIQQSLSIVALGLNYFDLLQAQKIQRKDVVSEHDAQVVLAYAIDAALQIEARVGDIQTWWY